jgi:phosphatidylglycerol:prolipoprotein diacylglycerol transferase
MIPYVQSLLFEIPAFTLPLIGEVGPLPIHLFGVLVALAVIVGDRIVVKEGVKRGLDARDVKYLNIRMVIGGFVMAHLVSVIFYYPERIAENPLVLLNIWSGLSSFGGFLGAAITYLWLTRREEIPRLPYADAVALGLAPAWILGRLGCFTAHDHPGRRTDFFLAVRYPEGARHDLGLYEMLFTIVIAAVLHWLARAPRPPGWIIGLAAVLYSPVRFGLDFLRATDTTSPDARYAGLTPAQWACIICLALGVWLMRRSTASPPQPAQSNLRTDDAPPTDHTRPETPSSS